MILWISWSGIHPDDATVSTSTRTTQLPPHMGSRTSLYDFPPSFHSIAYGAANVFVRVLAHLPTSPQRSPLLFAETIRFSA